MDFTYTYSFIIPHHNSPSLLNRCLNSIPKRDDIQIIVVDDNSDEDKKPKIHGEGVELIQIDSEHSKGAGRARNVGISKAKGKWLLFADCDDFYNNGFIDVLDQYKDKDIDVLYFNYDYKDGQSFDEQAQTEVQEYFSNFGYDKRICEYIKFRSKAPWNKMVKASMVRRFNLYFEEVRNGNDILFSMFVATLSERVEFCLNRLYVYLKNSGSIINKNQSVDDMMCKITHDIKLVQLYKHFCPELSHSVFLNVLRKIRSLSFTSGIKLLMTLLCSSRVLYTQRNEWVKLISSRRISKV